jgi:NAD(P)H-hydrate epimerase
MKLLTRALWLESELPVIVDATALDWIPTAEFPKDAIRVVTPHPGEAAHLLKTTPDKVQAGRLQSLRNISKKLGNCWVVLKGHQTLIGRSEGEIFVNPSGNPHLAQGGSGDALAGYISGLLAQTQLQKDVCKTICYAVWQHGHAADGLQAARANWVVEDLVDEIGNVR